MSKTGKPYWTHDMLAAVWGSPMVVDGKVYLGDEDGDIVVLRGGQGEEADRRDEHGEQRVLHAGPGARERCSSPDPQSALGAGGKR